MGMNRVSRCWWLRPTLLFLIPLQFFIEWHEHLLLAQIDSLHLIVVFARSTEICIRREYGLGCLRLCRWLIDRWCVSYSVWAFEIDCLGGGGFISRGASVCWSLGFGLLLK